MVAIPRKVVSLDVLGSPYPGRMSVVELRPPYTLHRGNVLKAYETWAQPTTIISDGAYGVRGFHGDTTDEHDLVDWYRPHIAAWDRAASPATTLWFWNTEVGWATVHPLLVAHGWEYVQTVTWDKGISHVAGNVNGKTIRRYPVVSEISVLYQRRLMVDTADGAMSAKRWLRYEWQRAGLALNRANEACGVKNAATRKYLTQDWLWYWPPGQMVALLGAYAQKHGAVGGRPYFSIYGEKPVTAAEWDKLRYRWNHVHGLTNVWRRHSLHDFERLKGSMERSAPRVHSSSASSASHLNQKPLDFMERQVQSVTNPGDVVWEPFGGLASASVAAVNLGRRAYVAEIHKNFQDLAFSRLEEAAASTKTRVG